jgi:putative flippase GtrA
MGSIVRFLEKALRFFAPSFIERRPGLMQFARYSVVGLIGAGVDFGTYTLMTRVIGIPPLPANMTSVFLAIISNYFFNKYWTFESLKSEAGVILSEGARFFIVSLANYTVQQLVFVGLLTYASLDLLVGSYEDFLAKVIAIVIAWFSNYFFNKYWTFRAQLGQKRKDVVSQEAEKKLAQKEKTKRDEDQSQ